MVAGIAAKQQALEDRLKHADDSARVPSQQPRSLVPAIHVVYPVILLENARDSEFCSPADRDLLHLWKTQPLRERV